MAKKPKPEADAKVEAVQNTAPAQPRISTKPAKLQKKNKSRLPRRLKKARAKAAAATSSKPIPA